MKYTKLFVFVILFLVLSIYVYAQNIPPTADAGINRNVIVNEEARLSGSGADIDGDTLTFKWQLLEKPPGSSSDFSQGQDDIPSPSFTPDEVGAYLFSLRTNDGNEFSIRSNVIITANDEDPDNTQPISYPGPNRNMNVGEESIIAGFGSDGEGDSLLYMWSLLSLPTGSNALLSNPKVQSPSFTPDLSGDYIFILIVNDGKEDSTPAEVKITASAPGVNRAPSADTGPNRTIKVDSVATLSGTGSDPDNDQLTFTWAVVFKPAGSGPTGTEATLSNNNIPNPTFTPNVEGEYIFSLTVDDGQLDSEPSTVKYTVQTPPVGNTNPTADAGVDINTNAGDELELQGSGADSDTLTFRWSIISMPTSSGAFLSNPNIQNPKFVPNVVGTYTFQLITNDGKEDSNPDTIDVNAVEVAQGCAQGTCDLNAQQWCNNDMFVTEGYCAQCGNLDSSCPICTVSACDADNKRWCDNGLWSAIDYCNTCGIVDASCDVECTNNACDTSNRQWCNDGVWEDSNYCLECGNVDSSCSFTCTNNACDTSNRQWCNNGDWDQTDYCIHCGAKDVSCGLACQNNVCDTTANRWCNVVFWASLNICSHCQDSRCLGTCTNNACDINSQEWCDNGNWNKVGYCEKCGNKDSSCSSTCEENTCDITANERCFNEEWTSNFYCDNCGLKDSDCSIACAEGECDILNKQVCTNGEWTNEEFNTLCVVQEVEVPKTCKDYGNCTISSSCTKNSECSSRFCLDSKCTEPTCNDGVKSGNETDVDCGGSACNKCIDDKKCRADFDCSSNFCVSRVCKKIDTCRDGILNDNETDVDCGGSCPNKCRLSQTCIVDEDCRANLLCSGQVCLEARQVETIPVDIQPSEEIAPTAEDKDNDGIPDEWEIQHGLNPDDASDSNLDFDQDGLTNIQEYTFGTNPNSDDSDRDGVSDKEEIDKGTDPLDADDKPSGVFGVIFTIFLLIIILVGGGYGVFYYLTKFRVDIPAWLARYIPTQKTKEIKEPLIFTPRRLFRPSSSSDLQERKKEIVEERRKEKREKREEILKTFGKKGLTPKGKKDKKRLISMSKEKIQIEKVRPGKEEVFSKLKQISRRRK